MMRMIFKAVVFLSLLMAIVLSINMMVGAQQPQSPTSQTSKEQDKTKTTQQTEKQQPQQAQPTTKQKTDATGTPTTDAANASAPANSDNEVVIKLAHGGMMEVELGKLAVEKAASDSVKQFAQRMIDDHSKANTELSELASQKGITLPTMTEQAKNPDNTSTAQVQNVATGGKDDHSTMHKSGANKDQAKMMEEHQKAMSKLAGLSGADFDREYMEMMVKDHEKVAALLEKASTNASDADIKAFAAKTLPVVNEHLQMARSIQASLKGDTNKTNPPNKKPGK